ncbi:hypothetical protein DUNSADRAFT_11322 [Dunaliella salina]|uniref:Uncharacterized protein n=1 Tax=Dunaliella salina TaxID=3046 RepID=A0ABQ7H4H2_DUNSA|nr:hypothetical protein DUNSADRAFT_11322 [Dunaliella salina]|eukprot:KAF5841763.1 hypothetical protein DUNSADRAFT_11322 [Dunaliella salina]
MHKPNLSTGCSVSSLPAPFVALPPPSPSPSPSPGGVPIDAVGSCSDPYIFSPVGNEDGVVLTLFPCQSSDSTFRSAPDFVIKLDLGSSQARLVTVTAEGIDTVLGAFTTCPAGPDSVALVTVNDDTDGTVPNGRGSVIEFEAAASTEYFVVLEPYDLESCEEAEVVIRTQNLGSSFQSPSPQPPSISPSPSPTPSRSFPANTTGPPSSSPSPSSATPPPASAPRSPATCDEPSIPIPLRKHGDFFKLVQDTCSFTNSNDGSVTAADGGSIRLGSKDYVIQVAADDASDRVIKASAAVSNSSNSAFRPVVLVSKTCPVSSSDDSQVAVAVGTGFSEASFVAQAGNSYFIILGEEAERCGFLDIRVEMDYLTGSGATTASCVAPYTIALEPGTFKLDALDTCEQANGMDGTLVDASSGDVQLMSKDFVIQVESNPVANREIQVKVKGSDFAPIIIATTECSDFQGNDTVVAWDSGAQASETFSITFTAKADTVYFVALEAASDGSDSLSCGKAASLELSVLSSAPSLPRLGRSGKAHVDITTTLDAEWEAVQQNSESCEAFKKDVCTALAQNLHEMEPSLMGQDDGEPCLSCVACGELGRGSVIVPATVLLKDTEPSDIIISFAARVEETSIRDLLKGSAYEGRVMQFSASTDVELVPSPGPSTGGPPGPSTSSGAGPEVLAPAVAVPLFFVFYYFFFLLRQNGWKLAGFSCTTLGQGSLECLKSPFFFVTCGSCCSGTKSTELPLYTRFCGRHNQVQPLGVRYIKPSKLKIEQEIGRGATSRVFKGEYVQQIGCFEKKRHQVAVKFPLEQTDGAGDKFRERFKEMFYGKDSKIHGLSKKNGQPCAVMTYNEGARFAGYIKKLERKV